MPHFFVRVVGLDAMGVEGITLKLPRWYIPCCHVGSKLFRRELSPSTHIILPRSLLGRVPAHFSIPHPRLQPLALTPEQIAANEADIIALCEKVGQDPSMLLASMPKTYTADTPTLFS